MNATRARELLEGATTNGARADLAAAAPELAQAVIALEAQPIKADAEVSRPQVPRPPRSPTIGRLWILRNVRRAGPAWQAIRKSMDEDAPHWAPATTRHIKQAEAAGQVAVDRKGRRADGWKVSLTHEGKRVLRENEGWP
jgi:hypothetical protein